MRPALGNSRWPIKLPDHRARFHEERPWWEAARLADMYAWVNRHGTGAILDVGSEEGDFTALYAFWGLEVAWIDPSKAWFIQTMDIFTENDLPVGPSFIGFAASTDKLEGKVVEEARFAVLEEEDQIARIRLDTFADLTDFWPDYITMDVEGSELAVLAGAPNLLTVGAVWWISVHDCDPHAALPSQVHEVMRDYGYRDQWLGSLGEHYYRFWKD